MPKISTPCGDLPFTIPGFEFPFPPSLSFLPLPFPPKFTFVLPDCDVIKNAVGAEAEPEGDSKP